MRVLIIEDEAPAFRRLQNLITEIDDTMEIIDVIDSIDDSVKWFRNHNAPDLVFMDIQLADGLSFEIFDRVKVDCPVIFTTAFDEYTLRAFKVNSVDYLLKPINKTDLTRSLAKWKSLKKYYQPASLDISDLIASIKSGEPEYKKRFLVKLGDRLISVDDSEIAYFQTRDSLVFLITNKGKRYVMDQALDELQEMVDPEKYFRLNRQFLARIDSIKSIHQFFKGKLKLELSPPVEESVTVSREKATSFKNWLGQ